MVEEESKQMQNPWIEQSSGVEFDGHCVSLISESMVVTEGIEASNSHSDSQPHSNKTSGRKLGFPERAFSAAGAAFFSAILVNPLDVAKVTSFLGLDITFPFLISLFLCSTFLFYLLIY